MDAVTSEITSENTEEKRNKDKLRKLCEQYRGKFPRIEGIHNTKEKAVAVLHFSAGENNGCRSFSWIPKFDPKILICNMTFMKFDP